MTPALSAGDHAFIFQNEDNRIVFAIPYESRFTLIGTTDAPFEGDASQVEASRAEIDYLCQSVSRYFRKPVTPGDVVWSYAGVRPLFDDGASDPSAVTRDYVLDLDAPPGQPPALSIFGGKITTFRRVAEQVLTRLRPFLPHMGPAWTAKGSCPAASSSTDKPSLRGACGSDGHFSRRQPRFVLLGPMGGASSAFSAQPAPLPILAAISVPA